MYGTSATGTLRQLRPQADRVSGILRRRFDAVSSWLRRANRRKRDFRGSRPARTRRAGPVGQAVTCGTLRRGCRSPGAEA